VLEVDDVSLPWGETAIAAMAVPKSWVNATQAPGKPETPSERVKDVVCGMMIEPSTTSATSLYRGVVYYFCIPACKARFDANPEQYVQN
jgi:YHS domain-containing protein